MGVVNNRTFSMIATRFNRLLVKLSPFKQEGPNQGSWGGSQMVVIQIPPNQTANILEIWDSNGNILYAINAAGQPIMAGVTTTVPTAGSGIVYKDGTGVLHIA